MTILEYIWHVTKYSVYGVKVSVDVYPDPLEIVGINVRNLEFNTSSGIKIAGKFKLYLYPLDYLSGDDQLKFLAWSNRPIGGESQEAFLKRMNNLEELLCSRHIDYLGLIQDGLAIDATGKGIYGDIG